MLIEVEEILEKFLIEIEDKRVLRDICITKPEAVDMSDEPNITIKDLIVRLGKEIKVRQYLVKALKEYK